MSEDSDGRVLTDLLKRLDNITQHVIEIKGDMFKRTEWNAESMRIYDQLNSIKEDLTKAIRETEGLLRSEVSTSESIHSHLVTNDEFSRCVGRVNKLEENSIPPGVVGFTGAVIGAIIVGLLQIVVPLVHVIPTGN